MIESSTPSNTVPLNHGLWMTPRGWEHWKTRHESAGSPVLTPAWPGMEEGEVEALNRSCASGWEEVGDYALEWAIAHVTGRPGTLPRAA